MNRDEFERLLESMDPQAALSALSHALKKHLTILDDEDRVSFLVDLFEESCADKIGSMVHR